MSIICLICKDKLLNNAPGSPIGSLNSLVENQVIATGCGHLYHLECLQCWFKTQKKKLQNQGVTETLPDHCPTCQFEVNDEQIRRIHLLEDHREALEKAKCLEKMENLEIYCHQLEISIQQLQQENDMLLNKVLSPPKSKRGKEEFAAIVKNDRVMWLKKDSSPLSGVVLSIFKKEGSLWVKLKLDKKIRTSQRSGLLGSFRFDKKQEWTVPFEDIVLEKDFKKNNVIDEDNVTSEPTTPTLFLPLQKVPSFRSSTMSLPGDYLGQPFSPHHMERVQRLQPILSYDFINNYQSTLELSGHTTDNRHTGHIDKLSNHTDQSYTNANTINISNSITTINTDEERDLNDQRDYVILNNKTDQSQTIPNVKLNNEGRVSPQDGKAKHVTFADDLMKSQDLASNPKSLKGKHFRDHDYKNVTDTPIQVEPYFETEDALKPEQVKITATEHATDQLGTVQQNLQNKSRDVPSIHLIEPSTSSTPCSSSLSIPGDMQMDVFIDSFEQPLQTNGTDSEKSFNSSCFDTTFTALFYKCNAFDRVILLRNPQDDPIQQAVQRILANGFVNPLRNSEIQHYNLDYSDRLYETIAHLCSSYLDLEELMTILFEYVFKIPPFINYSYNMCDYIHQFFIDFTDKEKRPTVQKLFEQSLARQDNLKLRGEPSPALFLQMPNSEDGIIHYEFVLPTPTLSIEHVLESGENLKAETCYCNKTATLQCAKCAQIHGKSPVLFCDDCSVLLEAIHDQMYHKLELSPISLPSVNLQLAAVICLKAEHYSVFLRNTNFENDPNDVQWMFIEDFKDGMPTIKKLPEFEKWVQSAISDASSLNISDLSRLQIRLLTECRMFLYLPTHISFA